MKDLTLLDQLMSLELRKINAFNNLTLLNLQKQPKFHVSPKTNTNPPLTNKVA